MERTDAELLVEMLCNVLVLMDDIGFDSEEVDTEGMYQDVQDMIADLTS